MASIGNPASPGGGVVPLSIGPIIPESLVPACPESFGAIIAASEFGAPASGVVAPESLFELLLLFVGFGVCDGDEVQAVSPTAKISIAGEMALIRSIEDIIPSYFK